MKPISSPAGTDARALRSDRRAISCLGLPSIWPHIEPEASRMTITRSAAVAAEAVASRIKTPSRLRCSAVMVSPWGDSSGGKLASRSRAGKARRWGIRSIGRAPLFRRRTAELQPVALGEIGMRGEAGGDGDVEDWQVGLPQQFARPLQPETHVIAAGRHVQMTQEQPLDLPHRQAGRLGKLHGGEWFVEIVGHQLDDLAQFL